jgi:hypothetical protein
MTGRRQRGVGAWWGAGARRSSGCSLGLTAGAPGSPDGSTSGEWSRSVAAGFNVAAPASPGTVRGPTTRCPPAAAYATSLFQQGVVCQVQPRWYLSAGRARSARACPPRCLPAWRLGTCPWAGHAQGSSRSRTPSERHDRCDLTIRGQGRTRSRHRPPARLRRHRSGGSPASRHPAPSRSTRRRRD